MRARPLLIGVVLAACAPYIGLKLAWLAGARPGVTDPELMSGPAYAAANVVTLLLDLVLILVVVVLSGPRSTGRLGRLLALCATIGLGLLLPVTIGAPAIALADLLAPSADPNVDVGLAGWVYAVVYSGFVVQFGCLAVATGMHLRRRRDSRGAVPRRTVLTVAGGLGLLYAAALTAWAAGSRLGLTGDDPLSRNSRLLYAVLALLVVATAVLTARAAAGPVRRFLALVGATSVWTWAAFSLLTALGAPDNPGRVDALGAAAWLGGVAAGLLAAGQLKRRQEAPTQSRSRSSMARSRASVVE